MSTYVTKEKLVLNGAVATAMRFGGMAVSFFLLPIFIRRLGGAMYGIWLIPSVALGQLGFLDLGFSSGISRNLATTYATGNREEFSESIWAGMALLGMIGLVMGGIIFFGCHLILTSFKVAPEHISAGTAYLRLCGLCLIVEWPLHIVGAIHKAGMLERYTAPVGIVQSLLQNILYIVLLSRGVGSLTLFKLINFTLYIVGNAIGLFLIRRYMPGIKLVPPIAPLTVFRKIAPYSLGTFFYSVISYLAIGIDTFLLGIFCGTSAITTYHVITKFFTLIESTTFTLMNNFMVAVMHIDSVGDRSRLERFLNKSVIVRLFIVCCMVFPAALILPGFLACWVGEEYAQYAVWGQLYLLIPLFACLGQGATMLRGCGELKFVNTVYTCSSLLNFIISLILVRLLGVGGVILGTVLAGLILGDLFLFPVCCRKMQFDWRPSVQYFLRAVLLNSLLALVLLPLINSLPVCWGSIIPSSIALGLIFASFNGFVVLDHEVRQSMLDMFSKRFGSNAKTMPQ